MDVPAGSETLIFRLSTNIANLAANGVDVGISGPTGGDVIVGLATDYCVKDTALDGRRLGYPTTVLGGAIRAVDLAPGDGDRALAELADG